MTLKMKQKISKWSGDPWLNADEEIKKTLHFPDQYLPYLKNNLDLNSIYQEWTKDRYSHFNDTEIAQFWLHLFPFLKRRNEWFYPIRLSKKESQKVLVKLRHKDLKANFRLLWLSSEKRVVYNRSIYFLLLEEAKGLFLDGTVNTFVTYYFHGKISKEKKEEILEAAEWAFLRALLDSNPAQRGKIMLRIRSPKEKNKKVSRSLAFKHNLTILSVWGNNLWNDIRERFKECFWLSLGSPKVDFIRLKNKAFKEKFEEEWRRVKQFPDESYGFCVTPAFSAEDMCRYASLPQKLKEKRTILWDMIDYVVLKISPQIKRTINFLELNRFDNWSRLLLGLFAPFVDEIIIELGIQRKKELSPAEKAEIRREILEKVLRLVTEDYNYLCKKKSAKDPFIDLLFLTPLGDTREFPLRPEQIKKNPLSLSMEETKSVVEKIKWVRPSYFICQQIYKIYLPKKYHDYKEIKQKTMELEFRKGDEERLVKKNGSIAIVGGSTRRGARSVSFEEVLINGKTYLTIMGLAKKVDRVPQTLRNLEEQGKIIFERHREGHRRAMRLFPQDKLNEILLFFPPRFKEVARKIGVSESYLRRLRKRLNLQNLSKIEQVAALMERFKKRRKKESSKEIKMSRIESDEGRKDLRKILKKFKAGLTKEDKGIFCDIKEELRDEEIAKRRGKSILFVKKKREEIQSVLGAELMKKHLAK